MGVDDIRNDTVLAALKMLPGHDVDRARAGRIRDRCHRSLRRRQRAGRAMSAASQRVLEFVLIATLCGGYLVEVVHRALLLR